MPALGNNSNLKLGILAAATLVPILVMYWLPPIPQDLAFHNFADHLPIAGIPNFWNVTSNIGFILVGVIGCRVVLRTTTSPAVKVLFLILFTSVMLIGIGSGYYHLRPSNDRLIFDRIPMTCVFMSFLSVAISQCISTRWGFILLFPFLSVGISSVLWWHYTETIGAGDLRFYGLVQFLPMLLVPLIFILFPSRETRRLWPKFGWIIGWYILAKFLEHYDAEILMFTHTISGHSLKHITASVATIYFIGIFKEITKRANTK